MLRIKVKGDTMQIARIKAGLHQTTLAKEINVSGRTIYTVENGLSNPSAPVASKIAERLKVKFDDIFEIVEEGE